jgi:hypothetical protein
MKTLQPTVTPYTVTERASRIYSGVLDIFDYNCSSDVVTPIDLAREQLKRIPVRGTLCVPGAGIGSYVLAALLEGFEPENIYAIELDPAYHGLGSGIFSRFGVNYICDDFLTWEPKMKFDVVIGNPPYQDSSTDSKDKKLWTKFVFKSLELLKEEGYLSFLTPNSLVGRTRMPAKMRKLFSGEYSLLWMNHDSDAYFKVGVGICSWCVQKTPYKGKTEVISSNSSEVIDLRTELPLPSEKKRQDNICEKIYANTIKSSTPKLNKKELDIELSRDNSGKNIVYYAGRNKFYRTNDESDNFGEWKVVFSFSATYKQWFVTKENVTGNNFYVTVDTPEQGIEIGNTLMHPVMTFYIDNWRRTSGFTPAIANKDSLPDIRGLSDSEVHELFQLTEQEVSYINSTVKPYSKNLQRIL